jgi:hypothetical protein
MDIKLQFRQVVSETPTVEHDDGHEVLNVSHLIDACAEVAKRYAEGLLEWVESTDFVRSDDGIHWFDIGVYDGSQHAPYPIVYLTTSELRQLYDAHLLQEAKDKQ